MAEDKRDPGKRELIGGIVLLAIIFTVIFFSNKSNNEYKKYEKTFKGETIGFVTRIEHAGKRDYLKYYYYSGRKILSEVSSRDNSLVDKFYKVKYDLNNSENNYIVLEEELKPDSITLVKAGFTKTKYYIYDAGVTCKYIEKSKWK
ncbi:hypothetical protein [Flavobacterium pectinovorum]|uniref:DUF3592 domain-containing protein n=1 Tax=Flavobacterium pectinovorum TaxID=29533 RepID=A0AB36P389_9FLAO|nr:hypothetical protein [Flavobacterium pectinovorum]OXB05891.1 hypothetical protein B0A72_07740 [Flavobacterium pectinovorum]SHM15334.1 hypothetical protein SAMN05444387_2061 [Flavobacterium pectinovorum]